MGPCTQNGESSVTFWVDNFYAKYLTASREGPVSVGFESDRIYLQENRRIAEKTFGHVQGVKDGVRQGRKVQVA